MAQVEIERNGRFKGADGDIIKITTEEFEHLYKELKIWCEKPNESNNL